MAAPLATRTSETGRVEAFSDAVFAIAMTLLVLDLRTPAPGLFQLELAEDWPSYVAYLAAFLAIASIWLTHHNLFTRIRRVDAPVLVANLALLLGAALVPWPTALLSAAIGHGRYDDEVAAIVVYAIVSVVVALGWVGLDTVLRRRPHLLVTSEDARWLRRNRSHSLLAAAIAVVAGGLGLLLPLLALLVFLAVPLTFFVLGLAAKETPEVSSGVAAADEHERGDERDEDPGDEHPEAAPSVQHDVR